ncbi:ankyrin repeat domain-containing protein 2 [Engraulis encrasicolus]|uniref:ankyrin repeat domain-containing protein 2 n=1 Tax=Engraulis encrasicolus TaxID=184585 RepID=UPI002FD25590
MFDFSGPMSSVEGAETYSRHSIHSFGTLLHTGRVEVQQRSYEGHVEAGFTGRRRRGQRTPKVPIEAPVVGCVYPVDFLKAAKRGKLKMVMKFLQDGGDPNTSTEFMKTALHHAAEGGSPFVIRTLLAHGADIHLKDRLGSTAVHWACRGGSLAALKTLHDYGADLNATDKILSTPLHVATRVGHPDVVEYLLTSGVTVNAKDREGDTALHDAVRLGRQNIAKMLILTGAHTYLTNTAGVRAMEQLQSWQSDVMETLQKTETLRDVAQ